VIDDAPERAAVTCTKAARARLICDGKRGIAARSP